MVDVRRRTPGLSLGRLVANDPYKRKLAAKKRARNEKFKRLKQLRQAVADEQATGGATADVGEDGSAAAADEQIRRARLAELVAEAGLDEPRPPRKKKRKPAAAVPDQPAAVPDVDDDRQAALASAQPASASPQAPARAQPGAAPSARGAQRAKKAERAVGRLHALELQRRRWEEERAERAEAKAAKQAQIDAAAKRAAGARKARLATGGKLSQRTARGQPVMRHQIDRLLAQVERAVAR